MEASAHSCAFFTLSSKVLNVSRLMLLLPAGAYMWYLHLNAEPEPQSSDALIRRELVQPFAKVTSFCQGHLLGCLRLYGFDLSVSP